jgi:general nucleoside transport system ATP-binding protein
LGFHLSEPFAKNKTLVNPKAIRKFANDSIKEFDIATPSPRQISKKLSGGNLQKLILAREFSQETKFLIASQPTRGLDVGSTEYVRRKILEQKRKGAGVLLISEDLDEVLNLSDRIAVIFKGELMDIIDAKNANIEQLGLLMAGVKKGES